MRRQLPSLLSRLSSPLAPAAFPRGLRAAAACRAEEPGFRPLREELRQHLGLVEEVGGMTRKQQQFELTRLIRGRGALRGLSAEQEAAAEAEATARPLEMAVIDVNRTVKVTKGGSLQRFAALVVVGNCDGVVGWAMGKAPEVMSAIDKAYSRASRSLFFFERFEGHTIFHETSVKFGRSLVTISPLPSGSGVKANSTVAAVCRLAGIKDLRAKVLGSHNPGTTLRAVFEALDAVRSPGEVALRRGRTVVQR